MNLHKLLFFAVVLTIFSCETKEEKKGATAISETIKTENVFEFGVWTTANNEKSDEEYAQEF